MSNSVLEKKLTVQNEGNRARLAFQNLSPELDAETLSILSEMKSLYRTGQCDHLKLLACVAKLCTLEDIGNRLKQKMNAADRLAGERLKQHESTESRDDT